jgi:hypothetical protein
VLTIIPRRKVFNGTTPNNLDKSLNDDAVLVVPTVVVAVVLLISK